MPDAGAALAVVESRPRDARPGVCFFVPGPTLAASLAMPWLLRP